MNFNTVRLEKNGIAEIYLTVKPLQPLSLQSDMEGVFRAISDYLKIHNAYILQERIFVCPESIGFVSICRKKAYREIDDGVDPTYLVAPAGINGHIAGIQIHAVLGSRRPEILEIDGRPSGRMFKMPEMSYLTLSSIRQSEIANRSQQAQAMFEKAHLVLEQTGLNFQTVPRTWMWLRDILDWYGDFNLVRNTFYKKCGIITQKGMHRMPASTGIGIRTENGALCAMELVAVGGKHVRIEYLDAGGKQESAFEYGSAFSRASIATTPAGEAIYISGTASIDPDGKTTHIGNPQGQIQATVDNIRALLKQCHCTDADVVQAVAYSKTHEIEKIFMEGWKDLPWPIVPVIADICRDDLLFEIELTAARER